MSEFPKLFELNTVIVNEEMSVFRFENKYQLLNEAGELVGYVCQNYQPSQNCKTFYVKSNVAF